MNAHKIRARGGVLLGSISKNDSWTRNKMHFLSSNHVVYPVFGNASSGIHESQIFLVLYNINGGNLSAQVDTQKIIEVLLLPVPCVCLNTGFFLGVTSLMFEGSLHRNVSSRLKINCGPSSNFKSLTVSSYRSKNPFITSAVVCSLLMLYLLIGFLHDKWCLLQNPINQSFFGTSFTKIVFILFWFTKAPTVFNNSFWESPNPQLFIVSNVELILLLLLEEDLPLYQDDLFLKLACFSIFCI